MFSPSQFVCICSHCTWYFFSIPPFGAPPFLFLPKETELVSLFGMNTSCRLTEHSLIISSCLTTRFLLIHYHFTPIPVSQIDYPPWYLTLVYIFVNLLCPPCSIPATVLPFPLVKISPDKNRCPLLHPFPCLSKQRWPPAPTERWRSNYTSTKPLCQFHSHRLINALLHLQELGGQADCYRNGVTCLIWVLI